MSSKKLKNLAGEIIELNPLTQSGFYIGMLVDALGRTIGIQVDGIWKTSMDKKFGITKAFHNRLVQLSNTKGPIQMLFLKMYLMEGKDTATRIENLFKTLLRPMITEGEYVYDDEEWFVNSTNSALNCLKKDFGIEWQEVIFADDEQLSGDIKDTIKQTTAHIYHDWSNIPDADINNPDPQYSVWELKSPSGEKWVQTVTLGPTVTRAYCGNKKLTPELVANYCNANNFLKTVNYDHTKLTATFITSSNDKDEINNFCINNGLPQFRKDYNKS